MDKENLKIKTYENGVSSLPDYPSDAGYSAEVLKAVFDSRSDNEIKEKHNALVESVHAEVASLREETAENSADITALREKENKVDLVSSDDDLASIIPADGQMYFIEHKSLPYKDGDGNLLNAEKTVYVIKVGDGEKSLEALPPVQNTIPGIGEGTLVQIIESEIEETYTDTSTGEIKSPRPTVTGKASAALGRYHKVYGRESVAVNYNNEIRGKTSFAAGSQNVIEETAENGKEIEAAFVTGHSNIVKAPFQTVIGTYSDATSADAFVIGNGTAEENRKNAFKVTKDGVVETGKVLTSGDVEVGGDITVNNAVSCQKMTALQGAELGNWVVAAKSTPHGKNVVTGVGSSAFGGGNDVRGQTSLAAGGCNIIEQIAASKQVIESSFVTGHNNIVKAPFQTVMGTYSDATSGDAFVVGNGSAAVGRRNAFVVTKEGTVKIGGKQLTLGSTVITESKLKALLKLLEEESV